MMIPGQKPESPIVYAQSADTFVTALVTKKNKANDNNNKYPKVQERLLQPDIHIGFCKHLFGVCELLSPLTYTHAYLIPQPCHSQTCWFFYLGLSLHFPENSPDLYVSHHLEFPSSSCHLCSINISVLTRHMDRVPGPIKVI